MSAVDFLSCTVAQDCAWRTVHGQYESHMTSHEFVAGVRGTRFGFPFLSPASISNQLRVAEAQGKANSYGVDVVN